eukprot:g31695.t1
MRNNLLIDAELVFCQGPKELFTGSEVKMTVFGFKIYLSIRETEQICSEQESGENLFIGWTHICCKVTVNGRTLRSIDMQRDLGVQVHSSLKVVVQGDKVVKKGLQHACLHWK